MGIVVGPTEWQPAAVEGTIVQTASLGDAMTGGGFLICRNGGTAWIVAPNTSEVSRTWYCRNDAITTATACTSSSTWFIPTRPQLQNPGYTCRTFWDSFSSATYWSSTEGNAVCACRVFFHNGGNADSYSGKTGSYCVRAFRCVTY